MNILQKKGSGDAHESQPFPAAHVKLLSYRHVTRVQFGDEECAGPAPHWLGNERFLLLQGDIYSYEYSLATVSKFLKCQKGSL